MDSSQINNSETIQNPPNPQDSQKPKTLIEKYGRAKVFLGAVLLVVIMETLAIYFLKTDADLKFFNIQNPAPTQQPPTTKAHPSPTPTTNTEPASTTDPQLTKTWKSYKNVKYGYTVMYPSDNYSRAYCGKLSDERFYLSNTKEASDRTDPYHSCPFDWASLEIIVTEIDKSAESKINNRHSVKTEEILIDNIKAVKKTATCSICDEPAAGDRPWIIEVDMTRDGKKYKVNFFDQQDESTFNQILSTFKFTQ